MTGALDDREPTLAVVLERAAARVSDGRRLAIFPEGTTTDGARLQRFHPRLLAAGQLDGVKVQPVALRYGTSSTPDPVAPFLGDDALLPHLSRLVRHPGLRVEAHFLPPLDGSLLSRRSLAERCRAEIAGALGLEPAAPPPPAPEPQREFPLPLPEAPVVEAA